MYFETIRTKDILKYIQRPNTIIIDLRSTQNYNKGHIPSAVNIPYEYLHENYHIICNYEVIIFYCERGNISLLAARDVGKQGFQQVKSLYGGINSYTGRLERI